MIDVAVLGAGGRMGQEVCRAVDSDDDLRLVRAVDPSASGGSLSSFTGMASDLSVESSIEALASASVDVAVDFTTAPVAAQNIAWCLDHGIHVIVGTTGLGEEQLAKIQAQAASSSANVLIAPNFAIGAVLMMRFAQMAAKWMPDVEIIELHHPGKLDSPSGTAIKTMEGILASRSEGAIGPPEGVSESIPGARGAESGGVHVHSVRLPGLVAHQEVIFGGQGQTLRIRHDSIDRTSFMPGVILAIKKISQFKGLTLGLENLLEI